MSRVTVDPGRLVLLPVLLVTVLVAVPVQAAPTDHPHVPGEIIVKFRDDAAKSDVAVLLSELGATTKTTFRTITATCERLEGTTVEEALAVLTGHPLVEYAEPNYLWEADLVPDDPHFDLLWGLHNEGQTGGTPDADIDAVEAWDYTTGSDAVLVAVIDTGVDYNHADLADNMWTNPGEIPGNGVDDDGNGYVDDYHGWDFAYGDNDPMDGHSHGTHCAGTIGAVGNNALGVVGVCWNVRIMPVKFLSDGGSGSTENAVLSVEYATMMGAYLSSNSWGGGAYSEALKEAIEAAGEAGALFVAAAGNNGSNNDSYPHYPSSYDSENIIAVAATDHDDDLAGFSCWGPVSVDLGAPGVDIYSSEPGDGYGYKSGTSMATPHVSGAVALVKAQYPSLSHLGAKELILNTAEPLASLDGKVLTGGRLNVLTAMSGPDTIPPAPIDDLALATPASNWVVLAWTATGDDGGVGRAKRYDLRYSTAPIDSASWGAATRVEGEPAPQDPGTPEELRVDGLDHSTTYFFALRVLDEYLNPSPLSNVLEVNTLGPPTLGVSPTSLAADLLTGEVVTRTLTVSNLGVGVLDFGLSVLSGDVIAPRLGLNPRPRYGGMVASTEETARAASAPLVQPQGETPNQTEPSPAELILAGEYEGDHLRFGLTDYGELLPFAYPVTTEHLAHGSFLSGYAVAYRAGGDERFMYAYYGTRFGIAPVSYTVLTESPTEVVVEVVTETEDAALEIRRLFTFHRDDKFVRIETTLLNVSGAPLEEVDFKSFADWDIGGSFDNDWDYDFTRNLAYAEDGIHACVTGLQPPAFMDIDGWDDRFQRETIVDYPTGPVPGFDGAEILHWQLGDLASGGATEVATAFAAADDLGELQAVADRAFISWLSLDPSGGSLAAGEEALIEVTIDATEICGGDYDGLIKVRCNDPATPETDIPVALHVTGEPDIALSADALDYGPRFLGADVVLPLEVSNPGCDVVEVTSLSIDNGEFVTDTTPFSLAVGEHRILEVHYQPASVGAVAGVLTLTCNDPDEPVLEVALAGEGVIAPEMHVAPDSLHADLWTGDQEVQVLTIANDGGYELVFDVAIEGASAKNARAAVVPRTIPRDRIHLDGGGGGGDDGTHDAAKAVASPATPAPSRNLTQPTVDPPEIRAVYSGDHLSFGLSDFGEIMPLQYPPGNEHLQWGAQVSGYTLVYRSGGLDTVCWAEYEGRYGLVPVSYEVITNTPDLVEVLVTIATADGRLELTRRFTFDRHGQTVQVETAIANTSGTPVEDVVFKSFADWDVDGEYDNDWDYDLEHNLTWASATHVCAIASLETPDLMDIHGWGDTTQRATEVDYPTGPVPGHDGLEILHFELGDLPAGGTTGVTTAFLLADDLDALLALAENAFVGWLTLDALSGVVPPGEAVDLLVTFDAAALCGGTYDAVIRIGSNDPLLPELPVPATLQVTGEPDIAVAPLSLEFGQVYLGVERELSVEIVNPGCDVLEVTGIVSDNDVFTFAPEAFTVPVGGSQTVVVTFAPPAAAEFSGRLGILSNDPDTPEVTVLMAGEGVDAPVIAVSPDTLEAEIPSGGTATRTLTIANTGGSDLDFAIEVLHGVSALGRILDVRRDGPDPRPETADAPVLAALSGDTPNVTDPTLDPPAVRATYTGDHLQFGLSDYGEIMPLQYPLGNEHLALGSWVSGYLVAYRVGGGDYLAWSTYNTRSRLLPVSYTELENTPSRVVVEVVTATVDSMLRVERLFTFERDGKTVRVETGIVHTGAVAATEVVFKSLADWDVDGGASGDSWNYDFARNMVYAWQTRYVTIAGLDAPDLMDIDGWDDRSRRLTEVDFPTGPVPDFDGLEVLHYELGDAEPGARLEVATAFALADDLAELEELVDGAFVDWLSLDPLAGVVPAGGSLDVAVTLDATAICGGYFHAALAVSSNDPVTPEVGVPVHLHVVGEPDVALSDTTLAFGLVYVGQAAAETLVVGNVGCDDLTVSSIFAGGPELTVAPDSFVLPAGGQQAVVVTYEPTAAGDLATDLVVNSDDPDEPVVMVSLTGTAAEPPVITISPIALAAEVPAGGRVERVLEIGNDGLSPLAFALTVAGADSVPPAAAGVLAEEAYTGEPIPLENAGSPATWTPPFARRDLGGLPGVAALDHVLVLEEGAVTAELRYYDHALENLGLARTLVTTWSALEAQLAGGTAWDLVIVNAYGSMAPASVLDALFLHASGGGLLLFADWGVEFYATHPLVAELGVSFVSSFGHPLDVAPLIPGHDCFLFPNVVAGLHPTEDQYGRDGQVVHATDGVGLATFPTHPGSAAIVHGADGNTLFNGFQAVNFTGDDDGDGKVDAIELIENEIVLVTRHAVWLTASPTAGVVDPGETLPVTVTMDATYLLPGYHEAQLVVTSNDPAFPWLSVPVELLVRDVIFNVDVTATLGGLVDDDDVLGAAGEASDGYDAALDLPEPPPAPPGYLSAYFPHPEWGVPGADRFAADIRAAYDPLLDVRTWTFVVESDQSGSVTLDFAPTFDEASGWALTLRDEATGVTHDLFPDLTYAFTHGGGAPRQFTIAVGTELPPLDPTSRHLPAGWSMIGLPLVPPAGSTLADVILDDAISPVFLYGYEGDAGYQLLAPETGPVPGRGMWAAAVDSLDWSMEGEYATGVTVVPLRAGWSLVGYPLWFEALRDDLAVLVAGTDTIPWSEAVGSGLVAGAIYGYEPAVGYVDAVTLDPWHGYWVAAYTDDLALLFDPAAMAPGAAVLPLAATVPDGWSVEVSAAGGDGVVLGMAASCADGLDPRWDLPAPPRSPGAGDRPRLGVPRPEWELPTGDLLCADHLAATDGPCAWPVRLEAPAGSAVALSWDVSQLPAGRDLQLVVAGTGAVLVPSLRVQPGATITMSAGAVLLRVQTPDYATDVPEATVALDLRNVPNPFNPQTEFRFNLPHAGATELRIYNLRGQLVRRLDGGTLPSGPARLVWKGRDERGGQAASGTYFYRLFLDGKQLGSTRKMSLLK